MKKLLITIFIIIAAIGSFFYFSQEKKRDNIGEITIIVIDDTGDTLSSKTVTFGENESLFDILNKNYSLGCANASYQLSTTCDTVLFGSRVILQIEDMTTDWQTSYIGVYENDEYSRTGIDSIILDNGDVFRFEYTSLGGGS